MDIFKPKNDQDTNNGRSVIKTGNNFQTLDTSKDVEPDFDILQNLYNFNFDDPIYYWLNSTGYTPAITPTITRTQTPTPSVTPTRTITPSPTPTITETQLPGNNSANFNSCADWNGQNGNVMTVGTNGGPSYYGTFDQSGNVFEWNDLNGTTNSVRGLRGGALNDGAFGLSSSFRGAGVPSTGYFYIGFRLGSSSSVLNPLNLSYFVNVANVNNTNDSTGYGGVNYLYQISQYLVTNCEYAEFLNSVASTDTYLLYNDSMDTDPRAGISRSGSSGSYTYSVKSNMGNKPVVYVNWFNCARYCNWLHNGKPTGLQNNSTTEDGAYTLNGAIAGNAVAKNVGANYSIPTENEWYKAAYYSHNKNGPGVPGYWAYATQNDSAPTCVTADSVGNGPISSNYSCSSVAASPTPTPSVTATPSVTSTTTPTPTATQTPTATITSTPTTTQTPTVTPSANNPLFLASVSNGSTNATTTDAVTWNYGNFVNNRIWTGLAYGNNKYLAVAYNSNNYEISSDGLTWNSYSYDISHPNNLFNATIYGNNKYLVFANSSTGLSSENLQTWSSFILPSANWNLAAYGNNTYVACISGSSVIATSNDGITWTQRALPVSRTWKDIIYANNRFVLIGENTNTVLYSTDGITWNSSTLPQAALWRCLGYGNGIYVALIYQSSLMAYSSDAITWQTGTSLPYSWTDLTYGNNTFIAVGTGAVTMTSANGLTWTQRSINNNNWNRLIFNI